MEDIKLWLWFTLAMGGHKTLARELYKDVGSIKTIYEYTKSDYLDRNINNEKRLAALCDKSFKKAEDTLWFAEKYGVKIIPIDSPEYPESLKQIYDPPLVLYVRGTHFEPDNELYIAMVGTKNADDYGYEMAYHLAKDLASAGVTVLSSMSKGLDGYIHKATLDAGGFTTAVLPGGVNSCYVAENRELMKRILNHGAVVSEYGFHEYAYGSNFASRNRIISGLCMGTIVVQAPKKSGTLLIAKYANDQGRDVFGVPGPISNTRCEGVNELIKSGAGMVTKAQDIIEEYIKIYPNRIRTDNFGTNDVEFEMPIGGKSSESVEKVILNCLEAAPKRKDEIIIETGLDASAVNGAITMLELEDRVEKDSFGNYHIKNNPTR